MSSSPDWASEESYTALKTVLKWELQHLLQRLAEIGEEALLLTVCVEDGGTTEMGSPRGQVFLSMSDLQNVKSEFKLYCQGVLDISKQMEVYRDLSSGQLTLGPKSSIDSEHRRKRRKKTYLQHSKVPRLHKENESHLNDDQELSLSDNLESGIKELSSASDDNSGENVINYEEKICDQKEIDGSVKLSIPMLSMRSRRKRIPQKVSSHFNEEDDNDGSCIPESFYQAKDKFFDNQSKYKESADVTQSMDKLDDNQSMLEMTCNTEEFSINGLPYDQCGLDIDISNKKSISARQSFTQIYDDDDNHEISSPSQNRKEIISKKSKDILCKSTGLNPINCVETSPNSIIGSEKSMPVFPNFGMLGFEKSVGVANNVGGAMDDCSPMTGEDGPMNTEIVKCNFERKWSNLQNENSHVFGGLSMSADDSPKIDVKQGIENSPILTPSRKKGFKPVPHDEIPAETALLDASKLAIGRYQCPMCGQTTRDRHDLKRHLRTHTKEKPYKCSVCNKKFTRKWDLENHYTRHNKTDRDLANSKIGKQFNRAAGESNTEVLTYDKLISKLVKDSNLKVSNADEEENIVLGYTIKKPYINSKRVLKNDSLHKSEWDSSFSADKGHAVQRKDLAKKIISDKLAALSRKMVKSKETCSSNGSKVDQTKTVADNSISPDDESVNANDFVSSEAMLDSSVVKFMNDLTATECMETGSDVKSQSEAKSDVNNDTDFVIKEEVDDAELFSNFDNKYEIYKITTGNDVENENETGVDVKMTVKQEVV